MKKELKDYIHLYLGCEVCWAAVVNEMGTLVGISKSEVEPDRMVAIIGGNIFQEWYIEEVKPILRPLSDMTEDESDYILPEAMEGKPTIIVQAAMTVWLLSKHFDLFSLIESGLAIDKSVLNSTTIKQ